MLAVSMLHRTCWCKTSQSKCDAAEYCAARKDAGVDHVGVLIMEMRVQTILKFQRCNRWSTGETPANADVYRREGVVAEGHSAAGRAGQNGDVALLPDFYRSRPPA